MTCVRKMALFREMGATNRLSVPVDRLALTLESYKVLGGRLDYIRLRL